MTSRSTASRTLLASLTVGLLALGACGSDEKDTTSTNAPGTNAPSTNAPSTNAPGGTDAPAGGDLQALAADCTAEGQVNLIALPDEWANYKGILQSFRDKYPGVKNPVANPNGSSKEEEDAVKTLKGQDDMPDSVDVSPAIAQSMVDQGLFEPYTATVDADIPEGLKDPDRNWYAAYYGVIGITTNTTIVPNAPTSFADLLKPEYKGLVALNGDPRESGSGFAGVMAAALANGGSADDIMPGIEFFAELKKAGNLATGDVTPATAISGETPIAIDWSYNLPGLQEQLEEAGLTAETNFPTDGVYGGFYSQGVVKESPHPACSRLWLEHILSDEGALGYLEGGAMPARYQSLVDAGLVDDAAKANLPPDELISQIEFLTPTQIANAAKVLADNWGPMVADA